MFDPLVPYNELPYITTLFVDTTSGLARLAEDTRVAIEILRYAVKTLPDPNILLDTLAKKSFPTIWGLSAKQRKVSPFL